MDFINNDGSYAHRGVWHITDNLTQEVVPGRETSYVSTWREPNVTFVDIYPEYIKYKGDAICGQRDGITQGKTDWGSGKYSRKPDAGGRVVTRHRVIRPDVVFGLDGYIPGPLCSRCAKKAGLEF